MLGFLGKLLDSNEKEISRLKSTVEQINGLEKKISKLTDKQLQDKFAQFQKEHQKGKSLDELLPEVYACVREAAFRNLKQRHFDVQLMASVALHQGKIAEQKTGEGKTLSASPAVFLNAVTGKGVHVITVNDYLAKRDAGWMAPIYHALGASVATIVHDAAFIYDPKYKDTSHDDKRLWHLKPVSRKEAYAADITFGTNNEFGFDYLRDNMALRLEDQVQRGHYFAIVDEVDSILIDEARTPLIISQPAAEATDKYYKFAKIMDQLSADGDYVIDEKLRTANLTERGIVKVEKILGVDNLYEKDFATLHHVEQALKARTLFQKDRDYVVRNGEVVIVDEFTGRLMEGRRYSEGLHQAIEAKEGVEIQQESQTLATISLQNYFRQYEKLAGMTGTASTEAEEFSKIYKIDVVVIPTNKDMQRIDHPDTIYKTVTAKYSAVANLVEELHKAGQPVLVGTTSIDKNEFLSELLKRKGISHSLLNAKNHEKEAEIIAKAGEKGAVTVATNMAGRGVDIQLGKGVDKLGGLYVIGTERHESRRIDNQLRGRSGRQGDPGATRFFVSLEDDLMRIFGGDQVSKVMDFLKMPEDTPIEHGIVSKAIEGAQKKVEGHNFDIRKSTVEYDDVMNQQRQIIYGLRKQILETAKQGDLGLKEQILEKVEFEIANIVNAQTEDGVNTEKILDEFSTIVPFDVNSKKELGKQLAALSDTDQINTFLVNLAKDWYEQREKHVSSEISRQMEVFVYLSTIDTLWRQHLDTMDDLRAGIGLRGYAQRDPLIEYKREAFDQFEKLVAAVDFEVVHRIYKVSIQGDHNHPVVTKQVIEEHATILESGVSQETKEVRGVAKGEPLNRILESEESTIKEENVVTDLSYAGTERSSRTPFTKVTVERDGQVVAKNTYGNNGSLQHNKLGRNDPCWCGSGKKYKRCHYPN